MFKKLLLAVALTGVIAACNNSKPASNSLQSTAPDLSSPSSSTPDLMSPSTEPSPSPAAS